MENITPTFTGYWFCNGCNSDAQMR